MDARRACNLNYFISYCGPSGLPWLLKGNESTCSAADTGSIPGSGRPSREGNSNPLQYSCLENPMDRGAWWATVHEVEKSWTRLSNSTTVTPMALIVWTRLCTKKVFRKYLFCGCYGDRLAHVPIQKVSGVFTCIRITVNLKNYCFRGRVIDL